MNIEIVLAVVALLVALYAVKSARNIEVPETEHDHDTYTRREVEQQVQGAMDALQHLEGRVYELQARVDKLEG